MKVLLVNGSPKKANTTFSALQEVEKALNAQEVETEIFQLGNKPIGGCTGCTACRKIGKCFMDDCVNEFVQKAQSADGFIFGTPVHYAAASGSMTAFLDRVFYSGSTHLAYKPGACITVARRGGTTATFDQVNKYFTINQMPIVSSNYWNMVHGLSSDEAHQDEEGMQTMRILGNNMAWLLKCIQAGKNEGIVPTPGEQKIPTNYIR